MTTPPKSTPASVEHARIVEELIGRWPEHRIAPSLGRIQALMDLLGSPEKSAPVIQVAGTNGKGSTAIMIDALLRADGLRTGRFSSPHLVDVTERICIDGEPISPERFDELWADVKPYVEMVDAQQIDGVAMTFFEVITGLAYAAFADAPVDVMVIEVGLGGTWDATSVCEPQVSVVCPIDLDHTHILGDNLRDIAGEKAGIIKPGSTAVLAAQQDEAAEVLVERATEVGARMVLEGRDFALLERTRAVGGQLLRLQGAEGPVGDIHLPLFGEHMAHNAALAMAAVEALLGGRALNPEVVVDGFGAVEAPARMELVRTSPPVVLDTCHNPHGASATMAALAENYAFTPTIGVVAMMADKDVDSVLRIFGEQLTTMICTRVSSTDRGLSAEALTERAAGILGEDRVRTAPDVATALELATTLADQEPGAGVLVAGSVILAGEARAILVADRPEPEAPLDRAALTTPFDLDGDSQW
ncbi:MULTISPECIES: bifunctional folylpolyglutamate synthase/dihydrofolate synthase [unclassified Luteococcus]|uniref:bifunctional folylpolyglutamate synthase/dihydrofolate synthase n=1 Tax=unclassified Luteococcus TaxID=2639923 RepID=UPI00313E4BC5